MPDLPSMLLQGERARLFPVLADTSKEGRTLSIFLACVENITELGRGLLSDLNVRVGARTKIEAYTEVVFQKGGGDKALRPDGLIVVQTGGRQWTALIEAKVGKNDLSSDQIESYLEIAKQNGIDALITISNQFAPLPTQHPVSIGAVARKKADIYHWSWMYILTEATLLLDNCDVADADQRVMLNEMVRFLSHDSAGVKSFDQMPAAWGAVVSTVQASGTLNASGMEVKEVVGAWHQEARDLSLILSRQLGRNVGIKTQRIHQNDPVARAKADAQTLCAAKSLQVTMDVPDAASLIDVIADLQTRSICVAMKLRAPVDKKTTKARLNWLLKQVQKAKDSNIYIRLIWPGRGPLTQFSLKALRDDPGVADEKPNVAVTSFEVVMVKECGTRFGQRKNFIVDLEQTVPEFYEQVGQHLRAWQAPAPRLREERAEPSDVDTKAIQEQADRATFEKSELASEEG